jgi:ketosteroid isomerase-like protein
MMTTSTRIHIRQLARFVAVGLLTLSPALLASCQKADKEASERAKLDTRLDELEAKEEIRSILLDFTMALDDADAATLTALGPTLDPDFRIDVTPFVGDKLQFEGLQGLVLGLGPILSATRVELAPSAIDVDVDGDSATASFKFLSSSKPPPELGVDVDVKVMVFVENTATLVRQDDGRWKLRSIEMVKTLAYPGTVGLIGG